LLAWLFNESPVAKDVVVDDRWGSNTREKNNGATYTTSEYGSGMNADVVWEENRGIGHSYGYNRNEQLGDYKSSHDLILMLVEWLQEAATCCSILVPQPMVAFP
jgi:alpha-L-fucosidase